MRDLRFASTGRLFILPTRQTKCCKPSRLTSLRHCILKYTQLFFVPFYPCGSVAYFYFEALNLYYAGKTENCFEESSRESAVTSVRL